MLTSLFLKLTYAGAEWIMWVLVALSFISVALIAERWLYFLRTRSGGAELAAQLHEELRSDCANRVRSTLQYTGAIQHDGHR